MFESPDVLLCELRKRYGRAYPGMLAMLVEWVMPAFKAPDVCWDREAIMNACGLVETIVKLEHEVRARGSR